MTYQAQSDINALFCSVAQRVAASQSACVTDPEFKSISEIKSELATLNPELLTLLDAFFNAYQHWHTVHCEIEASGKAGNLSLEQNARLEQAIENRDNSRNALRDAIAA
jgi:hypothetical protein